MGLYDTIRIPVDELPQLGIFKQLGIEITAQDFQTKDLGCNMDTYTLKYCKKCHSLLVNDRNNNLHGISDVINVYNSISTTDGIENYWVGYDISIRRGIIEYIVLNAFYKLGNINIKNGIAGYVVDGNSVPLDKSTGDQNE